MRRTLIHEADIVRSLTHDGREERDHLQVRTERVIARYDSRRQSIC